MVVLVALILSVALAVFASWLGSCDGGGTWRAPWREIATWITFQFFGSDFVDIGHERNAPHFAFVTFARGLGYTDHFFLACFIAGIGSERS